MWRFVVALFFPYRSLSQQSDEMIIVVWSLLVNRYPGTMFRTTIWLMLFLVSSARSDTWDGRDVFKNIRLPRVLANPEECPLNPCEVLKIISQYVLLTKFASVERERKHQLYQENLEIYPVEFELEKRIALVERRIRAVEQPVWKLRDGKNEEWNHCTEGYCRCLPDTKSLICWQANLKSLPADQTIPKDIVHIDLSRNQLTTMHKDTFRGLTHLKTLDLSENRLDFLPADLLQDLDGLGRLHLQSNILEELHTQIFEKLRNLHLLDVSKNVLESLPDNIFNSANKLRLINLSNNKIKAFPAGLLQEQSELEEFDISRNEIHELRAGSFDGAKRLKILDLSVNKISNISDYALSALSNLERLILFENKIRSISSRLFENLTSLKTLDLTMNYISIIESNAFVKLTNVWSLLIGQNSLTVLRERLFRNNINMRKLMMFSNNLTALTKQHFIGLSNLQSLMLNNNILKYVDADAFEPLLNLEKLRLDSNKLQFLPNGCLDRLPNLVSLKLDKNPWHCDCKNLYLARWLRASESKLLDGEPMCRGPGDLGGHPVGMMRYDDLCDGQWASMVSLGPRVPIRKSQISQAKNYTYFINTYLRNYNTTKIAKLETNMTTLAAGF